MTHSNELDKLFTALKGFQSEVRSVAFDAKVKVKTKGGGSYSFDYATLGALIDATQPALTKYGLSVSQILDGDGITTIVGHESGQFISGNFTLPFSDGMNAQDRGGVVTYFRRYGYSSALRINADKDDDANGAIGNTTQFEKAPWEDKPQKKARAPKPEPVKEESGDEIVDKIASFEEQGPLVKWYNATAKEQEDKEAFNDKYFPYVKSRIEELKS